MNRVCRVFIERFAEKQLERVPEHIQKHFWAWTETIERLGINAIRATPSYHDEKLQGDRMGQRSSRLSRAYRVIYEERQSGEILIIAVQEVNKHDY
jgi:proteic killer suppression protein